MYKDLSEYSIEDLEEFMESEECQQLDELSGATLGSYIQKARIDRGNRIMKSDELTKLPKVAELQKKISDWYDERRYNKYGDNVHRNKINKAREKIETIKKKADPSYPKSVSTVQRHRGIETALNKLKNGKLTEENFLDESQLTLAPNDAKYKASSYPNARKVTGSYGSSYNGEEDTNPQEVPAEKRGRGRPRKNKVTGASVSVNPILHTMFGSGSTRKESVEALKTAMLESIKTSDFITTEE